MKKRNLILILGVIICAYILWYKPDIIVAGPVIHKSIGIGTADKQSEIEAHNKPFQQSVQKSYTAIKPVIVQGFEGK